MQTGKEQMMAQQEIMAAKNMYNGKIDGIWGPKSIAAKQKWERSGKFAPAIPNNGFPLNDRQPLPPGVLRKPDGTLYCNDKTTATPAIVAAPAVTPEKITIPAVAAEEVKSQQQNGNNQQNPQKK